MLLVLPISQHREPRTADKKLRPVKTVVTGVSAGKLLPCYFYKTSFTNYSNAMQNCCVISRTHFCQKKEKHNSLMQP